MSKGLEAGENPLIPHRRLREIYTRMVEARMLGEYRSRIQRRAGRARQPGGWVGEEACRVSTALELRAGDLVSDRSGVIVTEFLRGAELTSLVRTLTAPTRANGMAGGLGELGFRYQLPHCGDGPGTLYLALGAAFAFKSEKRERLVLVYAGRAEASAAEWGKVLTLAAREQLAIVFVVLPEAGKGRKVFSPGSLAQRATRCGVPGIPVDADDAVALYRVAQESFGRARMGGGGALIECVANTRAGATRRTDAVEAMAAYLLSKAAATGPWMEGVAAGFARRLEAASLQTRPRE